MDKQKDILKNKEAFGEAPGYGFTVPEGYFDQLQKDIENKTISKKETGRLRPFPVKTWISVAALLACILIPLSMWMTQRTHPSISALDQTLELIDTETLENEYLASFAFQDEIPNEILENLDENTILNELIN